MTTALTTSPTTPAGFGLLLNPASLAEAKSFADMLSKSDLVPKAYQGQPGNIMIAGAMGARLGLDVFSALAGISVINGRPTLWGDAMLAVCQGRADFEDIQEKITGIGDETAVTCTIKRKGRSPFVTTFNVADAKRAGLWGKQGPWTQMPQRMMTMRARSFALRGAFADALLGFHAREELDDDLREVTGTVVPEAEPAKVREVPPEIANATVQPPADEPARKPEPAAEPAAPAPEPTLADVDREARKLHGEFGTKAVAELKAISGKLGVSRLSETPADLVPKAMNLLKSARIALQAGQ